MSDPETSSLSSPKCNTFVFWKCDPFLNVVHIEVTLEKKLLVTKSFKDYLLSFLYREWTYRTIIPGFEN